MISPSATTIHMTGNSVSKGMEEHTSRTAGINLTVMSGRREDDERYRIGFESFGGSNGVRHEEKRTGTYERTKCREWCVRLFRGC